jgi:hypothetical protein
MSTDPTMQTWADFMLDRYGPRPNPPEKTVDHAYGPGEPNYGLLRARLFPGDDMQNSLSKFVPNEYWNQMFDLQGPGQHPPVKLAPHLTPQEEPKPGILDFIQDMFKF